MGAFDTTAILLVVAAVAGYANVRVLRLPSTSGTLVVALASSLVLVGVDLIFPAWHLRAAVANFLRDLDFNATLMRGMLCFLLFAGALHVDLQSLLAHKWMIAALSTLGVAISTAIVGVGSWWTFALCGIHLPLLVCLVFGALISPTDPVAVVGLLRELQAPKDLDAQIAGESLFNDGFGVVLFFALASVAGLAEPSVAFHARADVPGLVTFVVREIAGGAAVGFALGYVAYRALKAIDDHPLELMITLALVMSVYALSFQIRVSGPIAVVVAGILIGNPGRQRAMSPTTRGHVDAFWRMLDELLNAVLFLLIGLQVFAVASGGPITLVGLFAIPIALAARWLSVAVLLVLGRKGRGTRGTLSVLTWGGLRGGISVAMMLSLPPFAGRSILLTSTYAVVVFSILVQGLTMRRVLRRYGVTAPAAAP